MATEFSDVKTETIVFQEGLWQITVLPTLTQHTHAPSYLVYKLTGMDRFFVALFAEEVLAYDYVAYRKVMDAGLRPAKLVRTDQSDPKNEEEDDGISRLGDRGPDSTDDLLGVDRGEGVPELLDDEDEDTR